MTGAALPPPVAEVDREARRTAVLAGDEHLDGIDFVEVLGNLAGSPEHVPGAPQQRTLLVHLLRGPVPDGLGAAAVRVVGGVRTDPRVNPVRVEWARPATSVTLADGGVPAPADLPAGVTTADALLVDRSLPAVRSARERVLVVRTSSSGDTSTYLLSLAPPPDLPIAFDAPLSSIPFGFTVDCPSDLDCCPPARTAPTPSGSPLQDYLARDYDALRARLLDRLSTLIPGWVDRSPADPVVMLAEVFAHLGDRFAYLQDAIGVEAYLSTARQRTSVRRHARMLDHRVHDGCASRVWLALTTDTDVDLPAGAPVTTVAADALGVAGGPDDPLPVDVHAAGVTVFETVARAAVVPARNQIPLHAWGDPDHVLPTGTTSAFLAVRGTSDPALRAGDVLVLADLPAPGPDNPAGGPVHAGDPAVRYAVRLVEDPLPRTDALRPQLRVLEVRWADEDALPGPLVVSRPGGAGAVVRAVALANVVLADHGATVAAEPLVPSRPDGAGPYRPRTARAGLAFVDPPQDAPGAGARSLATPDPRRARASVVVDDGDRVWSSRPDLVASGRLDAHVVAEPEADGRARLRFGDGVTGRAPGDQATYTATYRLGGGSAGNVAAGRLSRWLPRPDGSPAVPAGAHVTVWNPLPALHGRDPETLDEVRLLAPHAYRGQLRAVTEQDYADTASSVRGVQRSVDRRRWTGSWYVHEVTVDPLATGSSAAAVPAAVAALLEARRTVGVDVDVVLPVFVPLLVGLDVCLLPGFAPSDVELQVLAELSSGTLPGGRTGLFHPDRFTFGQPVYVSDVVAAVMAVPGVALAEVTHFARLGDPPSSTTANLAAGAVRVGRREVLRCDTDPDDPEAGRVELRIGAGS